MVIAEVIPHHDSSLDLLELRHRRLESALPQLVAVARERGSVVRPELVLAQLSRRERLGSTALGRGLAVTGAWSLCIRSPRVVVGVSERGVEWDAEDGEPVHVAACVFTPGESPEALHLRRVEGVVAALRLLRNRQRLLERRDPALLGLWLRDLPR
jgi:mannitol/fructose-specific phosphotransferase system IIA component (Ntr-type)